MKISKRFKLSTTQIILFGFIIAILIGSLLLALPVSSASGESVSYMDALFTATSSISVTGLMTMPVATTWSIFGQVVILIMIQIGGLGVVSIMSGIMIGFHHKMGIRDRILIQDAFNLNTLSGLGEFIKKVFIGTFFIEGIGALLYMFVFVPEFGAKGVWISIFNSVSAFCNAGIDIIGGDSLCGYTQNPMINTVTIILVILGGIGFVVWWDVLRVLKESKGRKKNCFRKLTLHSKIAISASAFLIVTGALCVLAFEYNNPATIGNYSLGGKIQASLFQSVTTRSAGFCTIPQQNLTDSTAILSLLFMFIGGSPVGTAGGIKTVTIAVLIASAVATIRNKDEVSMFNRAIPQKAVNKAAAVMSLSLAITLISMIVLSIVTKADTFSVMYEAVSASTTVGFSRGLISTINIWGKIIVIITMYLGRIGPISLLIAFNTRKDNKNIVRNPKEDISVG